VANIQKRPNGKWRARYRHEGKERSRHFSRKSDAQAWLDDITATIKTGHFVDPNAGKQTVEGYANGWEASQVGADNTLALIDNALRLHILPTLGQKPIGSLNRSMVQTLVKEWSESYAPGTVRNYYDVLSRLMAAAVDDKVLAATPCKKITLPPMPEKEVIPPTVEQVTAITMAMPERYRAAAVLLAGSGLRIGELLGLKVADVHPKFKTIRVERQRLQSGLITPPKSRKNRNVPVGQVVLDALQAHLEAFPSDEWLFTPEGGGPTTYQAWQRVWRPVRIKTGNPEMVTHDLRHFFASALIAGGASVKQVQTVLGHSSPMITLRTYAHLWPGDDDRTRDVMDGTLDGLRTVCGLSEAEVPCIAGQGT
jgi:integrase